MKKQVESLYSERIDQYSFQEKLISKYLRLIAWGRLLIFLLGVISVYELLLIHMFWGIVGLFLFAGIFIFLVKVHSKYIRKKNHVSWLLRINNNEISALKGEFKSFKDGSTFINPDHPFSFDIDIFGKRGLYNCINRTCSLVGEIKLANWLTTLLKSEAKIYRRQEAILELSEKLDWRQNFQATGYDLDEKDQDRVIIQEWLDGKNLFSGSVFFNYIRFILPSITTVLLIFVLLGIVSFSILGLIAMLQLGIIGLRYKQISSVHGIVSERLEMISKFSNLINCIESEGFQSEYLREIKDKLLVKNIRAGASIAKLKDIVNKFDYRLNMFAGLGLNSLLMWDLHCVYTLENWRLRHRGKMSIWFDVIAEFDALSSLACFHFNNKDYTFPKVNNEIILEAKKIGHPMINAKARVDNDFNIKKTGEIIIVTGANMAGKSTFLRTVGVNMVLAMIGAPVCAESFSFSTMSLFTSMRTSDSLQKNESYFYAELARLKKLMEELKFSKKCFFILDEILKGTNSKDKLDGSKAFLEQVIKLKGTGIVATHDLKITEMENRYPENIKNMCFEIEIDEDKIFFYYLLKEGVTQNMNASFLMKQMGIVG